MFKNVITIFYLFHVVVHSLWINAMIAKQKDCQLLVVKNNDCNIRYPSNHSIYHTWEWIDDDNTSVSLLMEKEKDLSHCLLPSDILCFYGDSLLRQLFTEISCLFGITLNHKLSQTSSGKPFVLPTSTVLSNNATMHYHFVFPNSYHYMYNNKNNHNWNQKCSHVILSHGIWHVSNARHQMSVSEYKSNMTEALHYVKALYPEAHISILPVLTASNSFNNKQPCYFPSTAYQNTINPPNHEEAIIIAFNKVIDDISSNHSISFLKKVYRMSSSLNCEKSKMDAIHWVQCQGLPTPLHSQVVKLLLHTICSTKMNLL